MTARCPSVEPAGDDVLVSTYVRRGRGALAVVGNVSKAPKRVTVAFSPQMFGLDAVRFTDPYSDAAVTVNGNRVTIEIAPRNFRMVLAGNRSERNDSD